MNLTHEMLADFRSFTRKISRCAGLVQGNITILRDVTPYYLVEMVNFRETCLHLHVGSFFAVKMEAISYLETMTGLYQITIVTMVIVSYLDLLRVLCDSFFCNGQTPAPLLVLNPANCHTDLVTHSFAIQINNFA